MANMKRYLEELNELVQEQIDSAHDVCQSNGFTVEELLDALACSGYVLAPATTEENIASMAYFKVMNIALEAI
jgi:hypothetical protein